MQQTNTNPETGIAYGYISAQVLDGEIVDKLIFGSQGTNISYNEALADHMAAKEREYEADLEKGEVGDDCTFDSCKDRIEEDFSECWSHGDGDTIEGTLDGVKYRTSWLGGALNVWIFESPHITHLARQASPCVPGAAILDTLDGNVTGYDVPPDWRVETDKVAV